MADAAKQAAAPQLPQRNISEVKNKQHRGELYRQMKQEKRKEKLKEKKRKKKEAEELGDEAPPKQVPHTIESLRVKDVTMVPAAGDDEVEADEGLDNMAPYFQRQTTPKILLTTSSRPTPRCNKFCKELKRVVPNVHLKYRRGLELKKIVPQAVARGFTDIWVIHEDVKKPNGLLHVHLPDGPTAHYKLTSEKFTSEIKKAGETTDHLPEVILNNFNTRLGHTVGRMLASVFPHDPQFNGRRVVTFHNQRDFIFFRHHRYQFRPGGEKCGLQELGPRFTLKLRTLQHGTFDSKQGEMEFVHKRHEMDTSRRKFFL